MATRPAFSCRARSYSVARPLRARLHKTNPHAGTAPPRCFTGDAFPSSPLPAPLATLDLPTAVASSAGKPPPRYIAYDYVVVGSGIAGLTYALKVAEHGSVAVITKEGVEEGCTVYAQGGVCAVLDPLDSVERHAHDTHVAGAFLNDPGAVDVVCREGADRVLELAALGAAFTAADDGGLHLTKEGGHTARRIVHAADATGAEISRTLVAAARAEPAITLFEAHMCVDLVVEECDGVPHCVGVDVLDMEADTMVRVLAHATMLASGGAGQLYPATTNPAVATGDGIAMAWRAAAAVGNMEFVQFHPTSLAVPSSGGRSFLISEALRGEGAVLRNLAGERFMTAYDDRLELAPRDVVSRAIHDQVTTRGEPHVLLDISHEAADKVLAHFPTIAAKCAAVGIDITRDAIPVIPAQHYLCGGVATGLLGETSVAGLFACGEVAYTGLHGANRLASNSLLEGLVFGARAVKPSVAHAEHAERSCTPQRRAAVAGASFARARAARRPTTRLASWLTTARAELQATMWEAAGIERTDAGLAAGRSRVDALETEVAAVVATYGVSRELLELRNLVSCASLVLASAAARRESRGLHYNKDTPELDASLAQATMLKRSQSRARMVGKKVAAGVPAKGARNKAVATL